MFRPLGVIIRSSLRTYCLHHTLLKEPVESGVKYWLLVFCAVTLQRWVSGSSFTCPRGFLEPFTQLPVDRNQDYTAVRTSKLVNETFIVKVGRKT